LAKNSSKAAFLAKSSLKSAYFGYSSFLLREKL